MARPRGGAGGATTGEAVPAPVPIIASSEERTRRPIPIGPVLVPETLQELRLLGPTTVDQQGHHDDTDQCDEPLAVINVNASTPRNPTP